MPRSNSLRIHPRRGLLERALRAIGELSMLRSFAPAGGWSWRYTTPYTLDSSRVNYELARELYRNINDRYKLGAAFARPVVNTAAGFMGAPHFTHVDDEADQELEAAMVRWTGRLFRINRNALRDGDVYARLGRAPSRLNPKEQNFQLTLTPPEWCLPVTDPLTGEWSQFVIRYPVTVTNAAGQQTDSYTLTETLTPTTRTIEADDKAPSEVQAKNGTESNPWGFIPIIHFRNEAEEHQLYGASELEPIEPFMRAYHDTLINAVAGSKFFARPKAMFKVASVEKFLKDNFPEEELRAGKLRFENRELFVLQQGEDAGFITADSGLLGITTLLKFLFWCVVDVSETPEFAFGTAVSSSKASVSEQMTPLSRKIRRKRGLFEDAYGELASMFVAMWAKAGAKTLETYRVDVDWDELSPKNDREIAETIKFLVEGLVTAIEANLLSQDAASEFLREFVPTMLPYVDPDADDDERRRVAKSLLWRRRVQESEGWTDQEPPVEPGAET